MNKKHLARIIPALGLLLATSVIRAQDPQDQRTGTVFKIETKLVVMHVTVLDENGHLVMNLKQPDFKVLEDGVQQQIKLFKREDAPVSIGIIIDNSNSMKGKRRKVEAAAMALVRASNPSDEVFIVNFNDEIFLDVPFTSDDSRLSKGVQRIDARGGTAMRDAVYLSLQEFAHANNDKKVLVVITDGNDNISNETQENVLAALRESEVLLYSIGLLNDEESQAASEAKHSLYVLASASGGEAYYPGDVDSIGHAIQAIASEIRSQYTVGYYPSNDRLDGNFRQVSVLVKSSRMIVRTRAGYYATPDVQRKPFSPSKR